MYIYTLAYTCVCLGINCSIAAQETPPKGSLVRSGFLQPSAHLPGGGGKLALEAALTTLSVRLRALDARKDFINSG